MPTPIRDQLPSQETAPANQRFEGQIIPDYGKDGLNDVITPMLVAEVGEGDAIVIDPAAKAPRLGEIFNTPVVAKLEFDGSKRGNYDTQALVIKVEPTNQDRQLRSYLATAESQEDFDANQPFFMLIMTTGSGISGFTTVKPSTQSGLLGRNRNNMFWYGANGKPYEGDHETEVIHNDTVAPSQLIVGYDKATGGLRLTGDKGTSGTVVTTVANDGHKKIVGQSEASRASEPVPERGFKRETAGKRTARLLRRRI